MFGLIKAIAVDKDGTITTSRKQFTLDCAAISAIRNAECCEIPVVIVSGANIYALETIGLAIGTTGPLIAENGAIVSYPKIRKIVCTPKNVDISSAFGIIKSKLGDRIIPFDDNKYREHEVVIKKTINIDEIRAVIREENLSVEVVDSGYFYHIKDPLVDKGIGLKSAAKLMKIKPFEIATIGDSVTDIPMFKISGLSFAVSNADIECKKNADIITKKPSGPGAAEAIDLILKSYIKYPKR